MNLTWRIVLRISLLMVVLLGAWAVFFYKTIISEVNDETDDALELLTENLINKVLEGEQLPNVNNGTNNAFYLDSISIDQANAVPKILYTNEEVFIVQKDETEPSRVLRTIFKDGDGKYYRLTVAIPTVDSEDLHEAITNWIILLYIALLTLIITVCLWVLWRTMRPLYKILKWLDTYDISNGVSVPINNKTKIKEFEKLNNSINGFVQRSEQLFIQQKQFIGNASHEIQTPLAICKNRLDLLSQTDLNEEQFNEISKIQYTLSYISRLNKELLLLAKIDAGQFKDLEQVDLLALVKRSLEDCNIIYGAKNIEISNNISVDNLIVNINPTLASIIITNLLKNAFVHNYNNGKIILSEVNGGLQISNTGEDTSLDLKIFERFYQGTKREGATGLGLALVKAISDKNNYKIAYNYSNKMHNFFIKF